MTKKTRFPSGQPTLADARRFMEGEIVDPAELRWLFEGAQANPQLDRVLAILTAEPIEEPQPGDGELSAALHAYFQKLRDAQLAAVIFSPAELQKLAGGQPAQGRLPGFRGAICRLTPNPSGGCDVVVEGLPSGVSPLAVATLGISLPTETPHVAIEAWPIFEDEDLEPEGVRVDEELLVTPLAGSSNQAPPTLSQRLEPRRTIVTSAPRHGESNGRPVLVSASYTPKVSGEAIVRSVYQTLAPGDATSDLQAKWDLPLPRSARRGGMVRITARDLTAEEFRLLPPRQASELAGLAEQDAAALYDDIHGGFECTLDKAESKKAIAQRNALLVVKVVRTESEPSSVLPPEATNELLAALAKLQGMPTEHLSPRKLMDLFVNEQGKHYWYLRRLGVSHEDAEEIVQDIFADPGVIRGVYIADAPRAYLRACIHHKFLAYLRRNERWNKNVRFNGLKSPDGELLNPEELFESRERDPRELFESSDLLERAMATLTEKQRTAIHLIFHEQFDVKEVVQLLRITHQSVYNLKNDAIKKLRNFLKRELPDDR